MKTANKIMMPNGEEIGIDGLYGKITNCLLEVPQRVKLELNDGTLTLKAGSQVIVPNGFEDDGVTPRFDEVTITKDIIEATVGTGTDKFMLFVKGGGSDVTFRRVSSQTGSGTTTPTTSYWAYYNTSTNKVDFVDNGTVPYTISFPIAIVSTVDGVTTEINQTFNGFGYIGSTVWVDKGVKGLIPNGRNEDGTLRNIEYTTENLIIRNLPTADGYHTMALQPNYITQYGSFTVTEGNYLLSNTGQIINGVEIGGNYITNGKITSFNPKQPFRAVDWSDLSESKPRIGQPQLSLDSVLPPDCIWLEGATVSRTTYSNLFAIYGTTYGAGDGSTTFVLPDFRNRAIWGSNGFGYIGAGLPNITGTTVAFQCRDKNSDSGALWTTKNGTGAGTSGGGNSDRYISFNASRSNSIYGSSTTVQPPAIKVRVYARYQ